MSTARIAILVALALSPVVTCLRPFEGSAAVIVQPSAEDNAQITAGSADKPWFCHDLDCPTYKVLNHSDGYETRLYQKGKWAVTHVEGLLYSASVTVGFKRLFNYISGENSNGSKIPMTAPVAVLVSPGQGPFCKSNFTVHFYVPTEFQEDTPEPTNKDVTLWSNPEKTVFVSQFGGYLVDEFTISAKVKALREDLKAAQEDFVDDGEYVTLSYDPPFRVSHRHNEIFLPKSD